jgi:hypothetical protein
MACIYSIMRLRIRNWLRLDECIDMIPLMLTYDSYSGKINQAYAVATGILWRDILLLL